MVLRGRAASRQQLDAATACHAAAVSKVYGTRETAVHALRAVTLDIPRGAFTAIMGPSGSGKSTLLHCLAALDTPTSGRVFLGGTELTALSRRQQAQVRRDRIGFVFQSFNLVPTLDALENITLPQLLAGRRPDRAWLHHVIARVGLEDRLHHRPSELSGGQQQRIALARALAGRPEVIFADEPTGNLDTTASHEMLTLLRDAVDQFDQTVVTVTHDPSIASYADQILYFSDGRVVDRTDGPGDGHVFDRPRQDHGVQDGDGRHDHGFPGRRRADGRQTMRSRRRRQAEEPAPGRPMVGSDDEVEVARQERWLQRIREQFEREQFEVEEPTRQYADVDTDPADSVTRPDDTNHQPAHWTDPRPPFHASPYYDDPHGPDHGPAPFHHDAAGADGWLPPERARLYAAPEPDAPEDPGVDTNGDRWRDDTVTRSDVVPWSRPATDAADEEERTQPTETSGWHVTGDPWAPADEHLAEEYHIERSTGRRGRGWQHDSGDLWSTGRWEALAEDGAGDERLETEPQDADHHSPSTEHDTDEHLGAPPPAPDDAVWRLEGGRHDARYAHWHHDDPADGEHRAATNGSHRNGRHDDAPPAVNGHERDPWTNLWDAATGPDDGEVWTPTFGRSWPVSENGHAAPDQRPVAPPSGHTTGEPAGPDDDPAVDAPPSAPIDDDVATHDGLDHREVATAPRARPSTRPADAPVPPPLASLRNTRRPDEPRDPMEALQSLQAQLDRLGGAGRRRPRRAGSGDMDRSER